MDSEALKYIRERIEALHGDVVSLKDSVSTLHSDHLNLQRTVGQIHLDLGQTLRDTPSRDEHQELSGKVDKQQEFIQNWKGRISVVGAGSAFVVAILTPLLLKWLGLN